MRNSPRERARLRLDERLGVLKPEDRFRPPPKGWIRAIRDALGMTGLQLASRLGIRPQTVETIEKSEAADTIQLKTLRRAAAALDCTLVYALIPNTTLEATVDAAARKLAITELRRVAHTMRLEDQDVDGIGMEAKIEVHIRDNLTERDLWREP
jgi:predicted DNA-binding mobile mystery protein A